MAKPQTAKKTKEVEVIRRSARSVPAAKNDHAPAPRSAQARVTLSPALKRGKAAGTGVPAPNTPQVTVQQLLAKGEVVPKTWRESRSFKISKLNKTDLEHYLRELLRKRAEILGDVTSMEDEALHRTGSGDLSNMPIHMAELGSDNYEQEFTLNLLEHEQKMLDEIDEAIIRISTGDFGVCQATGKPIGKPRLEAKPWAKHCIEYVREQERRGLM